MRFVPLALACVALAGCDIAAGTAELKREIDEQAKTIAQMDVQIKDLKSQLEKLADTESQNEIDGRLRDVKLFLSVMDAATLKPGNEGYATINFDLGKITVSIEDIKPYANGSKISLRFGNLQSTTIGGLKGSIAWGAVDKDGQPIMDEKKEKEFSFVKDVQPGSWAYLSVMLDGTPPQDLGFIKVGGLTHSSIKLMGGR